MLLPNFYKIALRHLAHQKMYAALNVTGLAVGLACMLLAVLYWQDERRFNLFHENAPQLFRITTTAVERETGKVVKTGGTRQVHGPAFKAAIPEIMEMTRLLGGDIKGDVRHEDRALQLQMLFVDDNFFGVFTFPLLHGNPATCLKELNSIVLSEETAMKFFGTTDAIGKLLHLDADPSSQKLGNKPMVVTGVARSLPSQSSVQFDVLLPMRFMQLSFEDKAWLIGYLGTFVVLSKDTDIQQVGEKMDAVFAQNAGDEIRTSGFDPKVKHHLQNIADIHLNPLNEDGSSGSESGIVNGSSPTYSNLFLGIAFFILLMASINFVNISIATSLHRAKEVGIRKINGSGRRNIFGQFLGESALLCTFAYVLALFLSAVFLPAFNNLVDKKIGLADASDWTLITGFVLVFLLTIALAGLYPAWRLSAFHPVAVLYNRNRPMRQLHLSKILVVMQFAIAFLLTVATVIFGAQMNFIRQKNLGYDPGFIVRSNIGGNRDYQPIMQFLKNETERQPCFEGISFGCDFGNNLNETTVDGRKVLACYQAVDPNYLDLLHILLRAGGNFAAPNNREILVNEAFVREAGLRDPVGASVLLHENFSGGPAPYTIVGVMADFHFESLRKPIQPLALFQTTTWGGGIWLKINRKNSAEALETFEKLYRTAMPGAVYAWHFLDDLNAREYAREQRWQKIVGIAAGLSLLICCLGLFGLAHLNTAKRTKEIGIRKVLGASVAGITGLLAKDFLKLVLIAIFIASPVAYYFMNQWLSDFAYRTEIQWWMFGGTALLALGIAFLTVGFQGIKAALADPVKALRSE